MTPHADWQRAKLALTLAAVDPKGLGGIWLRARSGPVRDRFVASLDLFFDSMPARVPPNASDDLLYGGLDLTATLDAGRAVFTQGALNGAAKLLMLTMAERCTAGLAARVAVSLEHGKAAVALDEGIDGEALAMVLQDRLAFHIDLNGLRHSDCPEIMPNSDSIQIARAALDAVVMPADMTAQVVQVAAQFGITSPRAQLFTLRAARALTAMQRETLVGDTQLTAAMQMVLSPRAVMLPDDAPQDQTPLPEDAEHSDTKKSVGDIPTDMMVDAVTAALPPDVLDRIKQHQTAGASGSGSGDTKKGNRRGRPKPSRPGRLGSAARIDLIGTLRAAAPWQTMRKRAAFARDMAVQVRASDIRLKSFEDRSDRLLIFVVDASGSSALARLSEAKGAVELLLAEAYARRDHVALIAFRGTQAEILLPPTRSLVQTKRRLSAMPGGGGTPLAAGLKSALQLSETIRSKGLTPTIAVLTDGRANIALDGSASRIAAGDDANAMARLIRARQTPSLVIDTGARPHKALEVLANALDAPYLPLPRAGARQVSNAIEAMLE